MCDAELFSEWIRRITRQKVFFCSRHEISIAAMGAGSL
jgi:hypothetical protein